MSNSRQARWAYFFNQCDFTITYIPGSQNNLADALSWRYPESLSLPQQNIIDPQRIVGTTQSFFNRVQAGYASLTAADLDRISHLVYKRDKYYYKGKAMFLPTKKIQTEALQMCHDSPITGHRGFKSTLELILRSFWWPSVRKDK